MPLINGDKLVRRGVTGDGRVVAVLDTGSESAHPMLAGKVVSEACYSTRDPDFSATSVCPGGAKESTEAGSGAPCPSDVEGCYHGTHVASITAGKSSTLAGLAPDAKVVAIQVFSTCTSTFYCGDFAPCALSFVTDQVKGLERVLTLKSTLNIDVVNVSVGGSLYPYYCDEESPAEVEVSGATVMVANAKSLRDRLR